MKPAQEQLVELRGLIAQVREGQATLEQGARLQQMIEESGDARKIYARYTAMQAILELAIGGMDADRPAGDPLELSGGWLTATSEDDRESAPAASSVLNLLDVPSRAGLGYFSSGWPIAYLIATLVFAVGLLIGSLVHVSPNKQFAHPSNSSRSPDSPASYTFPIVARVTGTVDCVWEGAGFRVQGSGAANQESEIRNQTSVHLGDRLALRSGLVELTYDSGAKVILQGPITYEVDSPVGGYLAVGKLTAKLEKKSAVGGQRSDSADQKSGILSYESPDLCPLTTGFFAIRTPTAIITDLGTEFGVEVDKSGATQSHVFRGSVRLQPLGKEGERAARILHANESARVVSKDDNRISDQRSAVIFTSDSPIEFVRNISKRTTKMFDLVDVVAGGDGFSKRRGRGIDATTGHISDAQPNPPYLQGDSKYHPVKEIPFIDGVFIPDNRGKPVQISSTGMTFDGFLPTNNKTFGYLWAGGQVPFPKHNAWNAPTALDGVDYSSAGHGLLYMHANNAITFDLDAIRRANPGWDVACFLASAGNAETDSRHGATVSADIWVLVDGQMQFRRRQISGGNGAYAVRVPIQRQNRFLTLAATDGENTDFCDEILFGDPRLELQSNGSRR